MPSDGQPARRIGRPPKVDEHGTPTRERLLAAAIDACVEYGYEGVTLSDIARRADVSTPAVYSHFTGKAELLVEASQRELFGIGSEPIREGGGLRATARSWLAPEFARTRVLVCELHQASLRHEEVAALLGRWQAQNAGEIEAAAGLTISQVKMFYILLMGTTHVNAIAALEVPQAQLEREITSLIEGWLADRYP